MTLHLLATESCVYLGQVVAGMLCDSGRLPVGRPLVAPTRTLRATSTCSLRRTHPSAPSVVKIVVFSVRESSMLNESLNV